MALQLGAIVGGYRVLQALGSGGMGTVYLAQNPVLPRCDALKVLNADLSTDDEFRARFEREANLAAGLDHPNIVAVYNRGEENGQLWIAMQYVAGVDACDEAEKGPSVMTPQRALRIVSEVGKGLDYAHRRGLLHRDVKPANFLLSAAEAGDEERVLLTDFGIAKSSEDGQDLTATGHFMATVAYAPPEQLVGTSLDNRADIYSLGCSFFALLTGQNPYPSAMPAVVMMGHLHEPPPKPSAIRPGLPPALDAVIEKVLAKDPAQRYATCREFTQAAEAALYGTRFRTPQAGYSTDNHIPVGTHSTNPTLPVADEPYNAGTGDHTRTGTPTTAFTQHENTDQTLVTTQRNNHPRSGIRRFLIPAALTVAVITAVTAGTFYLTNNGPDSSGSGDKVATNSGSDSGRGGDKVAEARKANPQFSGKTVTALYFTNLVHEGPRITVLLDPSEESKFLQNLGFVYNTKYKAVGNEKTIRELDTRAADIDSEVVIVLRVDGARGVNGGLLGLPRSILSSNAKIVVIDDMPTIRAFTDSTGQFLDTLVDKMVPAIAKVVN